MFRILVVEDAIDVLMKLQTQISQGVIGSFVDTAETVREAEALIDRMEKLQEQYDCAILDFNLPVGDGNEGINDSLCLRLQRDMKNIGVIHITSATQADQAIHDHIKEHHSGLSVRACALVDKADTNFYRRTSAEIRQFLYSTYIDGQLERLFSSTPFSVHTARSVTTDLQAFERDALQMWPDLLNTTKDRVRRHFEVSTESSSLSIRLK